ncbi:MAG: hypothetical protein KJN76_04300, partial [Eudoraea sp.]|nr:hypothetical protein [Eudoraea sp.]
AIYFYLHFLYNGWMILSLIGLLLFILEKLLISLPHRTIRLFLLTFNLGVICSFFLSTLFADPPLIFYFLGGLGAIIQLLAFVILGIFIWNLFRKDQHLMTRSQFRMLKTISLLVFLKMALQIISAHPYFAQLAAVILDFTIGYLHLTFLGVVTIGLFLFLNYSGLLNIPKRGYYLYLIGFIISEALIFYRAIAAWIKFRLFNGHSEFLAAASFLMVIALIHILIANYKHAKAVSADT